MSTKKIYADTLRVSLDTDGRWVAKFYQGTALQFTVRSEKRAVDEPIFTVNGIKYTAPLQGS